MKQTSKLHTPELFGCLSTYDFNNAGLVGVFLNDDEGFCLFNSAFWREEGEYIVVYTEHSGYHTFNKVSVRVIYGPQQRDVAQSGQRT